MREFTPTTAAHLLSRGPTRRRVLIWVIAKDRSTGEPSPIGFWTGDEDAVFSIGGEQRTYLGAGELLGLDHLTFRTGLSVQTLKVTFSQVAPGAQQMVRGYEARHAPVQIHRALFDPNTDQLVDEPHVVLRRGYIDRAPVVTPQKGGTGKITLEIATSARALTKPLSRKRSHAGLIARAPGDNFRQYASLADKIETPWGKNG